jgi:hypothetical protein
VKRPRRPGALIVGTRDGRITGADIIAFADTLAAIKAGITIAYLRAAAAALDAAKPDIKTARQLIDQALVELGKDSSTSRRAMNAAAGKGRR